jgi:GDPmannose 4,6-dehydratase
MKKKALITGINGMDGSYLAEFLLDKNYKVYGLERRSSVKNRTNTKHLEGKITFLMGDLTDQNSLFRALKESDPDEVYNLAAQSFVGESWNTPEQTSDVTGLGALRMLEAIREYDKPIKFYQASTSELYGRMVENPAKETTPFYPRSPYGVAKLYAHWITKNYRESYDMYNVSGILFNHESERRGLEFVTRKITDGVARISLGLADSISLGNLDAKRDWGYAKDYVEAMWMMLQLEKPEDYVIATGEAHSIREFLDIAFNYVGISDWSNYVKQDPRYFRHA